MALLEDHLQWIALGLGLILVLGTLLVTLRARRRSLLEAMAANAERAALDRKTVQENASLRERVSNLEHMIECDRGIEDNLGDAVRIAQSTGTARERREREDSERILDRSRKADGETAE